MASSMIVWLNENLKLSKQITNIEKDFADGLLFSEVISRTVKQHYLLQLQQNRYFNINDSTLIKNYIVKKEQRS